MLFGTQAWSEEPFSFAVLGQGSGGNVVEGEATLSAAFSTSASTVEQTSYSHARDILNRAQGNGFGSNTYPFKGLTWGQGTDVYISNTDSTGIDIEFVQGTVDQDNEFQPYNTDASYVRLTNNTGGDIDFSSGGILAKWRYISKSGTTYTYSDFGGTSLTVVVVMGAEADPNRNLGVSYWGYGEAADRFDGIERDYAGNVGDFTWADGEEIRLMFAYEISGIDSTSSITVSNYSTDIQIDINELVLDYNNRGTSNINYQNSWDVSTDGIRIVIPDRTEFVPGTKDIIGGLLIDDPAASMDAQIDQTTTASVGSGSSVEASSQFDMTVTPVIKHDGVATMDLQFDQTTQSTNLSLNFATLSAQFDQTNTPTYISTGNTSTMSSVVGGDITALKIAVHESTASAQFDQTTTPNKVHGAQATMDANVTHTTDAVKVVSADATMDANVTQTSTPNVVRGFSGYVIGNSSHTDGGSDRIRTAVSSMESIYEQAADAIRKAGGVASMDALFEKTVDDQVILSLVSTMDMNFPQTSDAIRLAGGTSSMDANFTNTTVGNRLLQVFNLDINSQFDQTSAAIKRMFGTTSFNMLFDADFAGDFLWGKSLQNIGTDGSWVNIDADTLTQTQLITSAVTVATGTNQYGTGNKYYIQGYTGASPTVTIEEGKTFRFTQDDPSNATHPLRFSTTPNGTWGGGVQYTTGVTVVGTAGQAGSYTQITVAKDTPTLYYYCVNHSGMGGQINTPGSLWVDLSTGEVISGNWEDRII